MFRSKNLLAVSSDQGHQFGLPAPLDLVRLMTDLLSVERLIGVQVDTTGDAFFQFSNELVLVAYVHSMGYETFQFSVGVKNYIGMGGGELSVYEP